MDINHYPKNVGIIAIDTYFPNQYVSQSELEKFHQVKPGKYTRGLGQNSLAYVNDREDIYSLSLSAVSEFMEKFSIKYVDIGRLEVGTETIVDHSKSIKTVLMQLFTETGNNDVEGVDTINACYGGTSALFNSIAWVESRAWDGRYALVVMPDIAEYAEGRARTTGGCGVVTMLVGPDSLLRIQPERATHMEHVYDFYKPNLDSHYPVVDGMLSINCYFKCIDKCYQKYRQKLKKRKGIKFSVTDADYVLFHTPFVKLSQKGLARMYYNDFLDCNGSRFMYTTVRQYLPDNFKITKKDPFLHRELLKAFMNLTEPCYTAQTKPGVMLAKFLGNIYTGSLYACLNSLLYEKNDKLSGKKILMFSYGSGMASTLFSIHVGTASNDKKILSQMAKLSNFSERLKERIPTSPQLFKETMDIRELQFNNGALRPSSSLVTIRPGTFCLVEKDNQGRRYYKRHFPSKL